MQALGVWVLGRVGRAVAVTAGLMMLLVLQPEPVRPLEVASETGVSSAIVVRTLILSEQARRYLALQYRAYPTEFMGCMIGEIQGDAVVVSRIAPADVDPAKSTSTHVIPKRTCEEAGWTETVGIVHSHPSGERCWYYFPGTQVASSDAHSFLRQPYPVDAIMCGTKVVWIGRDRVQKQIRLERERPAASVRQQEPGNRVHDGAASPTGRD